MSVATKNPFALLADDEAPSAPAPAKTTAAPAETAAPKPQQKKTGPASRGGSYYKRGGAPKPAAATDDNATEETGRFDRTENRPERGRGRGRGRGGRGGRGGGDFRGRQYDRHSATGLTDSDKKISNSWGGANNEFAHENLAAADAAADAATTPAEGDPTAWGAADTAAEWAAPAEDVVAEAAPTQERERRPRQEEEEDNTLTLDEYLSKKTESSLAALVPKLEGDRKPNVDNTEIWKDAIQLTKDVDDEAYFAQKTKAPPKPRAKKEEKVVIEIDARFPPVVRGGARGGRGGDRGNGRGRGARREGGERRNGGAPRRDVNLDDQSAFPALS